MTLNRLGRLIFTPCVIRMLTGCLVLIFLSVISVAIHWVPCPTLSVSQLSESQDIQFGGADPARFIKQGQWLFEGRGYMYPENVSCTSLPPGYPLFLSLLMLVSDKLFVLQMLQVGFRTITLTAMWLRLRRVDTRFANTATVLLATSPVLARQASTLMSECLGFCLMVCLLIQLLDLLHHGVSGSVRASVTGFLLAAICFTSPFFVFPAIFAFVAVGILLMRSKLLYFALLAFGAGLPYIAWQVHCIQAAGHLIPEIYGGGATFDQVWLRSWAKSPVEFINGVRVFLWRMPDPDWSMIPEHAWTDARMQSELVSAVEDCASGGNQKGSPSAQRLDDLLADAGKTAKSKSLLRYYVGLPVLRAVRSWSDVPEVWYNYFFDFRLTDRLTISVLSEEIGRFGIMKAALRQIRAVTSGLVWGYKECGAPLLIHVLLTTFFLICVGLTLRSPGLTGIAVLLGVLVFSLFHAYSSPELRRVAPLYPLVVFMGAAGLLERRKRFTAMS